MTNEKDKMDIQNAKKRIEEQVESTKKIDLGLDADGSSAELYQPKSKFDDFINPVDLPPLEDK